MRIPQVHWYALLLTLMLVPLSLEFQGSSVNVNYSLALLPLFALSYRVSIPAVMFLAVVVLGSAYASFFIFFGNDHAMTRQIASAVLLMLPVLILFCRLPFGMRELENAVIAASVLYSMFVFWTIYSGDFTLGDIYIIKNNIEVPHWPQRFSVVLLFGLFMAFGRATKPYYLLAGIILACLFLTFTRAAWLGVAVGMAALLLRRKLLAPVLVGIAAAALAWYTEDIGEALAEVYGRAYTGIEAFFAGDIDPELDSEATRVAIWASILKTVMATNFLTGLGGGGIYLIAPEFGSAHSQYMDIFVRTGILGLAVYVYFWLKAIKFYFREDAHIFAALMAVGAFGLFHETTNSPYVALVFYLLVAHIKSPGLQSRFGQSPNPSRLHERSRSLGESIRR